MSILSAIIYGIIQGASEFLPISSSAHLIIAQHFLGGNIEADYFTFDILLHLATLLSVTVFYIKDILPLFPALFRVIGKLIRGKLRYRDCDGDERLIVLLFVASTPLLLVPLFGDKGENIGIGAVAFLLILNGIILFLNRTVLNGMIFEGAAALMLILPPPYVIPVFADEPSERVQVSSALSALTLITMLLFVGLTVIWGR